MKRKKVTLGLVWSKCDLSCDFCPNLNEFVDDSLFYEHIRNTYEKFVEYFEDYPFDVIDISFNGTEMFNCSFSNEKIDTIFLYMEKVYHLCLTKCTNINVYVYTNLVTSSRTIELLMGFIEKTNACVFTSFDFEGRFKEYWEFLSFSENIKRITHVCEPTIQMVVHTKNIASLKYESNEMVDYFKYLYQKYRIRLLDYIDCGNVCYQTSLKDKIDFYCWMVDNYPKTVDDYLNTVNQGGCGDSVEIIGNVVYYSRCDYQNKEFEFVQQNGCLMCQYFGNCNRPCVCEGSDICLYKKVRDYKDAKG